MKKSKIYERKILRSSVEFPYLYVCEPFLKAIVSIQESYKSYICGGYLRDALLKIKNDKYIEIDFLTTLDPYYLAHKLAQIFNCSFVSYEFYRRKWQMFPSYVKLISGIWKSHGYKFKFDLISLQI